MILSCIVLLLTLVASIHCLTLPKDGDDLAILTGDRREHRRNHPAEAPPPTTTTTTTTTSTSTTTTAPNPYADCTFSSALFIACIFMTITHQYSSTSTASLVTFRLMCCLALFVLWPIGCLEQCMASLTFKTYLSTLRKSLPLVQQQLRQKGLLQPIFCLDQ